MATSLSPSLTVADIMTSKVFAVGPGTSIETAARLLAQKRVSGAPVVQSTGEVVGVVSLADLVDPDRDRGAEVGDAQYYMLEGGSAVVLGDPTIPRDGTVGEIMTVNVLSIHDDIGIVEAGERMLELGVHRLIVVDRAGILSGIVSAVDLLRGFVHPPVAAAVQADGVSLP
jgi:predicted transcriptional regulator